MQEYLSHGLPQDRGSQENPKTHLVGVDSGWSGVALRESSHSIKNERDIIF